MKKTFTKVEEVVPFILPNFILVGESKEPIPISDFTEDELRELCMQFTEGLIKKSKEKKRFS